MCDKASGSDRECKPCSERCGEGVTECVGTGGGEAHCKECNFGDGFYNEDRDGDGFGECKFCSPCRAGRYLKVPCSGHEDNECEQCRTCADDEVEVEQCSATQDTVCEPAASRPLENSRDTPQDEDEREAGKQEEKPKAEEEKEEEDQPDVDCGECPDGEFLAKMCDKASGSDRECKPCSERCGEGVTECVGTGGGEAHCKECNFGDGFYNEDRDGDGFGECKFCSPCRAGRYLKVPCSGHEDNECEQCSICGKDEVEVEPCRDTQDTVCEPAEYVDNKAENEDKPEVEDAAEEEEADGALVGVEPTFVRFTNEDGKLRLTISAGEGREGEGFRVSYVFQGDNYDSAALSSPTCDGPDLNEGEVGAVVDSPAVLDMESEWTAVAARICPSDGNPDYPVMRAIYSSCSCFVAQYTVEPCDTDTGAPVECKMCDQCTDGSEGVWGRCRGPGPEDCLLCGGQGGVLELTDGEYGKCVFSSSRVAAEDGDVHKEEDGNEGEQEKGGAEDGGEEEKEQGKAIDNENAGDPQSCENICEEGYFLAKPCDDSGEKECKECRVCKESSGDGELFESRPCNNSAIENGDRECSGPQESEQPKLDPTITTDGKLRLSFALADDGASFDDFYMVYRLEEGDGKDEVDKPSCRDDGNSDGGGAITDSDEGFIDLDADKWWSIAVATCPKEDNKRFTKSEITRLAISGCGCKGGWFAASECEPGSIAVCEECSELCGECKGPNDDDCSKCADEMFLVIGDNADQGTCTACTEECPEGHYRAKKCSKDSDMECLPCSAECEDDEVQVKSCSLESDRVCLGEGEAQASAPVIDKSRSRYASNGRLYMYLTLPEPLSFEDFTIAYAWVPGDSVDDAPGAMCGIDDSEIVNVVDEEVELRRDEDWIVLSAIACPKAGVPYLQSEVYEEAFSACFCPDGYYVDTPCEKGERMRECEPCSECLDGEVEVRPCTGKVKSGGNRQCEPLTISTESLPASSGDDAEAPSSELPVPAVSRTWAEDDKLQVAIQIPQDEAQAVHFRMAVVSDDGGLQDLEAPECEGFLPSENDPLAGILAADAEKGAGVFMFDQDAVVAVAAVTCPVGLAASIFRPSPPTREELSLCACGPGLQTAEDCSQVDKTPAVCHKCEAECGPGGRCDGPDKCSSCGDGFFMEEAGLCSQCAKDCGDGMFTLEACTRDSDTVCQACSECSDGEVEAEACGGEKIGADTVCKAQSTAVVDGGSLPPVVEAVPADMNLLAAGGPAMTATVSLPEGYDGEEWFVKHTSRAFAEYDAEAFDAVPEPDCNASEGDEEQVGAVQQLWAHGEGYGWVVVKAITCPASRVFGEASKVATEVLSTCSCKPGERLANSCDLLAGTAAECIPCGDEEEQDCPEELPPPRLFQVAAVLPPGAEETSINLHSVADAYILFAIDPEDGIPGSGNDDDSPCISPPSGAEKSDSPVAEVFLTEGTHSIWAVACKDNGDAKDAIINSVLTAVVNVYPHHVEEETGAAARVAGSTTIEMDVSEVRSAVGADAQDELLAQMWTEFFKAASKEAGATSSNVVVTSIAESPSPQLSLRRRMAEVTLSQLKIDYEVITTAEEAAAINRYIAEQLAPGELTDGSQLLLDFFPGAKLVEHTSKLRCSAEQSMACEVEWTDVNPVCASPPLEMMTGVTCGQTSTGFVLNAPGACGEPCPSSCTASGSCTEVVPCQECECSIFGCGSGVAVSQRGPEEVDKSNGANTERVPLEDGQETPPTASVNTSAAAPEGDDQEQGDGSSPWWIWVAVCVGVVVVLGVAVVAAVLFVRRRRNPSPEDPSNGNPSGFIFSSAYEEPRDAGEKSFDYENPLAMGGVVDDGQVRVTVNAEGSRRSSTRSASTGGSGSTGRDSDSGSEISEGVSQHDMI